MNALRRLWSWLTTPHRDTTPEDLKLLETENERKAHLATTPEQPDLSDDPNTDVPAPHLGQVQHIDLSRPVKAGQPAPSHLQDLHPSDWDLLTPDQKALFEQITPHDESKIVRYPAPVEMTTADWVTDQLKKAGYSEAYRLRFAGFRRVGVGMSMRYLGELKARADRRDESLTVHQLLALRSRGIS